MITRNALCAHFVAHLNRQIALAELVDWAENIMMDGEFHERDTDLLTEIVARLGYKAQVTVVAA